MPRVKLRKASELTVEGSDQQAKKSSKAVNTAANLDGRNFINSCKVRGKEGRFYIVKRGVSKTRICNMIPPRGCGELVDSVLVYEVRNETPQKAIQKLTTESVDNQNSQESV